MENWKLGEITKQNGKPDYIPVNWSLQIRCSARPHFGGDNQSLYF